MSITSKLYNSDNTNILTNNTSNLILTEKLNKQDIDNIKISDIQNESLNDYTNNTLHQDSFKARESNLLSNTNIDGNITYKDLIDDKFTNNIKPKILFNYLNKIDTQKLDSNSLDNEQFWIDKPQVLFTLDNFYSIFPTRDMNKFKILNTLTRLFIYLFILYLMFGKQNLFLIFIFITVVVIIALYYIQKLDKTDTIKENLCVDNVCKNPVLCRGPTVSNPFMNLTMADVMVDRERPVNCKVDEVVANNVNFIFDNSLYRDVDDFYNKSAAQRQFYTTPCTTVANDQKRFANWLYRVPETCKENQINCLRYEDVRFNRHNPDIDAYSIN